MAESKSLTVRNIPERILEDIKQQADKQLRSVNNQILFILKEATKRGGK